MAAADIAINIAAQFTGKNAFQKADKATAGLQRSVKNLGMAIGIAFSARAIVNFSKLSVKAFADDEKAARSLALALANTGNAFASIQVEKFIADLQRTTGVLDDNLRPAFRTLLTATGDVKKSQDALALALDISAGTGKDLAAVSAALARGFSGQTTGLSRLGAGLSKATLATGDMDAITEALQTKFSGQALEATKGFSGQMDLLTVSVENAKEAIGEGLVGALAILAGTNSSTSGSVEVIERMATGIAEGAKNIAFMIKQFEALKPVIIAIGALLLIYFAPITAAVAALAFILAKGGENLRKSKFNLGPAQQSPGERIAIDKANAAAKKKADKNAIALAKTNNALKKIDNDNTSRKLALTGDELALKELEKKFDVERIGLYAALNQTTDSETKMRLLSLVAIHDQNAALAGMIKKANEAENAFAAFIEALRATIRSMLDSIMPQVKQLQTLTGPSTPIDVQREVIREKLNLAMPDISALQSRLGQFGIVPSSNNASVVVNVQGSVTTERDLVSAITQGIYNNQASGIPISYSTAYR